VRQASRAGTCGSSAGAGLREIARLDVADIRQEGGVWSRDISADGTPIHPLPEAIDALRDVWPISEAFQRAHVSKSLNSE